MAVQFQELIGQDAAKAKFKEAVRTGRLAHALMLAGPSGVGKLAFANAIAQYVNCLDPSPEDSCGKCSSCQKIRKGIHPDLRYILPIISKTEGGKRYLTADYFDQFRESFFQDPYFSYAQWQRKLGGESKQLFISVHEIRALKKGIYLKAFEGKSKVILVWNAERINKEGANAFLKLLEEPPDQTMIIMTCSDPSLMLTTINSRCQQIGMERISPSDIQNYLKANPEIDESRAIEIAGISEGSIGNAKEYLTESNSRMSQTYIEWLRASYKGDYALIQSHMEGIIKENKEFQKRFLQVSIKKMRDSLLFHLDQPELALVTKEERQFQENFSKVVDASKVGRITELMEDSWRQISGNANAQMVFTALSLRMFSILRG